MDNGPTAILIFAVLLLFDIIFCGFSAAMEQLNIKELEERAEEKKDRKTLRLVKLIHEPQNFMDTFHSVITLIPIIIGWLYMNRFVLLADGMLQDLFINKLSWKISTELLAILAGILSFFVLLYILMLAGITLPKKIALGNPKKFAYLFVDVVYFFLVILKPFTGLLSLCARGIMKLLGLNPDNDEGDVTEEEIIHMVNEGHEQGLIEASEVEMISNIFEFHDKEAQDIMTHRNNIIAIDGNMLLCDVIDFVLNGKQSRYPVYEENIDNIIGILHLKDVLRYHADKERLNHPLREVDDLLREPEFIPLTRNIHELFKEMQSGKLQMVMVVDEYGQTAGLVAMEDILEEIVGNILDEYDEEEEYIEEKGNDEYIIEGKTPLEEMEERFQISFHEEEFETINGFVIAKMDKIPDDNEEFEIVVDGYLFKILSVQNKMIQSVLVMKLPEENVETDEETVLEENTD